MRLTITPNDVAAVIIKRAIVEAKMRGKAYRIKADRTADLIDDPGMHGFEEYENGLACYGAPGGAAESFAPPKRYVRWELTITDHHTDAITTFAVYLALELLP